MALNPAAGLTLDKIMNMAVRALAKRLSPILALSTVRRSEMLTETNIVKVPFYSLETLTSKDFDGSYSFTDANGGPGGSKDITVNKRKYQPLEGSSGSTMPKPMRSMKTVKKMMASEGFFMVQTDGPRELSAWRGV